MTLYNYISYFFIYAFFGWCLEVAFAAFVHRRFVNRGFLNGPLCPIYGFGVLLILLLLRDLNSNIFILFVSSVIVTSALEWLTGFVLEKVFHQKWWDYTNEPFNLNGYICLTFSLLWGLACVFVERVVHPIVSKTVSIIPVSIGNWILIGLLLIFVIDLVATVISIRKLQDNFGEIEKAASFIKKFSNEIGGKISDATLDLIGKSEDLQEEYNKELLSLGLKIEEKTSSYDAKIQEVKEKSQQRIKNLKSSKFFGAGRILDAFPNIDKTQEKWFKKNDKDAE